MESEHPFWSALTYQDLAATEFLKAKFIKVERRRAERLDLSLPATIITARGASIPAITRDISRHGIGVLMHGLMQPGEEATVRMTGETQQYEYPVVVRHCNHFEENKFFVGMEYRPRTFADET